jgi:BirA family biotin operon repressor/biotin-[acetyl-CoA-carboxylase] ligase
MSVVLRARAGATLGAAPLRVGLAVVAAIEHVAGAAAMLKWPNDVLLDGRKVAGILCEGIVAGGGSVVIAGIGINVLQEPADFADDVAPLATSLRMVTGRSAARAELAGAVLRALRVGVDTIGQPLGDEELRAFAVRDALRGLPITIDGVPAGVAAGITADGELRVQDEAGVRRVHGGTVRIASAPGVAHERAQ